MTSSSNNARERMQDVASSFVLSKGVQVVVLVLSGLSMTMAIGFGFWTFLNRKGRVVNASQPFFLYMICLGVFILALGSAPLAMIGSTSAKTSSVICNLSVWLYVIGCSVILSALEAKLDRINRIMRSSIHCIRVKVTVYDTIVHMFRLVGLNVFLLILMTTIFPVKYHPVSDIELNGEIIELRGACVYKDSMFLLIAVIVVLMIALVRMVLQAYNARKLSTEYSESKFIFIILVTADIILVLGIPVLFLAREHVFINIRVYVASAMNFTICASVLHWIFVPKIIFERGQKTFSSTVHVAPLNNTANETVSSNINYDGFRFNEQVVDEDDDGGERIITRRSKNELAEENESLRRQIHSISESVSFRQCLLEEQGIMMKYNNDSRRDVVSGTSPLPHIDESENDGESDENSD